MLEEEHPPLILALVAPTIAAVLKILSVEGRAIVAARSKHRRRDRPFPRLRKPDSKKHDSHIDTVTEQAAREVMQKKIALLHVEGIAKNALVDVLDVCRINIARKILVDAPVKNDRGIKRVIFHVEESLRDSIVHSVFELQLTDAALGYVLPQLTTVTQPLPKWCVHSHP